MKKETIYPEIKVSVTKVTDKPKSKKEEQPFHLEISSVVRSLSPQDGKHYFTLFVSAYKSKLEPSVEDHLKCINEFNKEVYKFILAGVLSEHSVVDDGDTANQSEEGRLK